MAREATRKDARIARIALAAAILGVFLPWLASGPVRLGGTDGPNNGWLIAIVAALAFAYVPSMARGSKIGIAALLGVAVFIGWTALENWIGGSRVLDGSVRFGLLLVLAAGVTLAVTVSLRFRRPSS